MQRKRRISPKQKKSVTMKVIGWREWISLPELGIDRIKAKIDTGAKSSSIHAFDVEFFNLRRKKMVRFKVHPNEGDIATVVTAEARLIEERVVKNSGGTESNRPVIETKVEIHGKIVTAEITLASRDSMGYRMLIGRSALKGFLVNPDKSFLAK
jgi:hypothetical protein